MSLFTVDHAKCKRDGACVDECPARLIEIEEAGGYPTPVGDAEGYCINCGHCVAVCPHGALALRTLAPEQCVPMRADWAGEADRLEHLMRARRSARAYLSRPVEKDVIDRLLDTGRYAPTGSNRQTVGWVVVQGQPEVQRLAAMVIDWMRDSVAAQPESATSRATARLIAVWESGIDRILRGAPCLLLAHGPAGGGAANSVIALSYVELLAPSLGLGCCWAGYFATAANQWPPLRETIKMPDGHSCFGALMIGYPKHRFHRLPQRNEASVAWL
jgi:nitroreductase/NAD-dependent dihydropyrimidine dehydrogenase PreA subunit